MLTALYSGMNAARSAFAALHQRESSTEDYQLQMESVRRSYLARMKEIYRREQRWADGFWQPVVF